MENYPTSVLDGNDYVDFNNIDGFSTFGGTFTVVNQSLLSVNFINFTAKKAGATAVLKWITAEEVKC